MGTGGVDGKSISERIAPLPKGERSPTKKASMHGKKEGAGHSIPVFWDPVVPAFDRQLSHLL